MGRLSHRCGLESLRHEPHRTSYPGDAVAQERADTPRLFQRLVPLDRLNAGP